MVRMRSFPVSDRLLKAGGVGGAEPKLAGSVNHLDRRQTRCQFISDRAGAIRRVVIDNDNVNRSGQRLDCGHHGRKILALVVGGQNQGHA